MEFLYNFSHLFLFFLCYSVLGWAMEVILTLIEDHKYVDRGFLIGPYCPIYGWGILAITYLLKDYTDNFLVLFILASVICMVLEYTTSFVMEKLFKARWWDYSERKFNINGRICLETTIPFGIGAAVSLHIISPFINKYMNMIPHNVLIVIGCILFILFVIDTIVSTSIISKIKNANFKPYKDNTEEITHKIKEYLKDTSKLTKRLYEAFPNVKSTFKNTKEKIEELKEKNKKEKEELDEEFEYQTDEIINEEKENNK